MITIRKVFVSEYDEEKWLCKLGKKGYLLVEKKYGKYKFEKVEEEMSYMIDFLGESPETPDNKEYLKEKSVCGFKGNSAYIKNGTHNAETLSRHTKRYGKLAAFFGVLTLLFAGLFAYNFKYVNFFNSIEYTVPADSNEILSIFDFVVGKNPAVLFMWVIALFLSVSAVITLTFGREWLLWKNELKSMPVEAEMTEAEEKE